MTSTTSASPAQASSAPPPPVFSYAQAAKGRTAVTPASAALTNQGVSGLSTPAKDTNSATNTPSASINGAATGSEGGDREKVLNGNYNSITNLDPLGVGTESESRNATLVNSIPGSPSFGTTSTATLPKEEDITLVNTAPSESVWDRHTPANGHNKSTEPTDGRRGKKGKKQRNADKEAEKEAEKQKEEEKKLEMLVAAPPPTVNIWQQRAQSFKVKPSSPTTQTPPNFTEALNTVESAAKPTENKRKGKPNTADDGEKISSPGQSGHVKELTNIIKGQKKGSEGTSKAKEDTSNKRAGPRGSRVCENEKSVASQLPPPVEDAISWPTPETALEEERRKALEKERSEVERSEKEKDKEERDDSASHKRPKQKYVAVPFVPTVNFNTPLPANRGPSNRGGRGRGGGGLRGGRDSTGGRSDVNGGSNGERVNNGSAASPPGDYGSRGRGASTTIRATSLPPNSNKRPSSNTRAQGKTSIAPNTEKTKATQTSAPLKNESSANTEPQRTSNSAEVDQSVENQQLGHGEIFKGVKLEDAQGSLNETVSGSGAGDRRNEPNSKGSDQFKDGPNFGKDAGQARDRADGRGDRGRGGYRGRGGHNSFANVPPQTQPLFTGGHAPQLPNGFPVRQNSNPYTPSMQQPPFSNQYVQAPPTRGGRGGTRPQSIPNNVYSRLPQNGNPQMAPLQTAGSMYDYQQAPLQPMSADPYNGPYSDQINLLAMVSMQLEYYFSIDNLCKDVFLRKHMDSQGFVFLAFIAGFKRIQALTQEIELLRYACQESREIDLIKGEDGVDRLRRRDGWEKWVLGMEERDLSVRNSGPAYHHRHEPRGFQQVQMGLYQGYPAMSPPMFSPNGTESRFTPQYINGSPIAPVLNGNGSSHHTDTPLSATVPDFAPSQPPVNGTGDRLEAETTFGDDQVANLKLVFASPKSNDGSKAGASFHNASSRTFSNGSIDGRSIAEEILDPRQRLTNGSRTSEISPDGLRRSRSPFAAVSPTTSNINNAPPVMWAKGQRQPTSIIPTSDDELYLDVRDRALKNRELSTPGETHPDMKLLYEFWSHFLCRNFNPTMYFEFRSCALADVETNSTDGLRSLITYYDETLNNRKKVIPDTLARHYVDIVKLEKITTDPSSDRPAFSKLRSAWRNGALDMKSRKKIDNLVDGALREELER